MAQVIKDITLEVSKPNVFQALVAKQTDSNSRFLNVTLVNEGEKITIEPSSTVTINACKPNGDCGSFDGKVNADGTAKLPVHAWILELAGLVKCDVSVMDSEEHKLTSTTFLINVEQAANEEGFIPDEEWIARETAEAERVAAELARVEAEKAREETAEELFAEVEKAIDDINLATTDFANALKGTANGMSVIVDDVSPIGHDLIVNVSSDTVTDFSTIEVKCAESITSSNVQTAIPSANGKVTGLKSISPKMFVWASNPIKNGDTLDTLYFNTTAPTADLDEYLSILPYLSNGCTTLVHCNNSMYIFAVNLSIILGGSISGYALGCGSIINGEFSSIQVWYSTNTFSSSLAGVTTPGWQIESSDNMKNCVVTEVDSAFYPINDKPVIMKDKIIINVGYNKDINKNISGGQGNNSNSLSLDNTTPYEPTGDYNPATKKYVDDLFVTNIDALETLIDESGVLE